MPNQATRRRRGTVFAAGMGIAVMLAACGSSHHPNASPNAASSTTSTSFNTQTTADPNQQYNAIPFNVGDVVGLPNGWSVQVAKVTRPYVAPGMAVTPAGQQYVAVDVKMVNSGTATSTRSEGSTANTSPVRTAVSTTARSESRTPFGFPIVPDV